MSHKRKTAKKPDSVFFPLFNEFPKDIRVLIWEAALPRLRERVVRIREAELEKTYGEWYDERRDRGLPIPDTLTPEILACNKETRLKDLQGCSRPPQILFVCREAYETAILFYIRLFEADAIPSLGIYFSPKLDVLYPRYCLFFGGVHGRRGSARDITSEDFYYRSGAEQVRNLALLFDEEAIEELESSSDSLDSDTEPENENEESGDFIEPKDVESLVASVLLSFEGVIRHLTIVVKDFSVSPEDYTDDASQLLFIDPLEVDDAFQIYHWEYENRHKLNSQIQHRRRELPVMEYDWAVVDMEKLEKLREESAEKCPDCLWTVPEIEYKVAIPKSERNFVRWLYWVCRPRKSEVEPEIAKIYRERMANIGI